MTAISSEGIKADEPNFSSVRTGTDIFPELDKAAIERTGGETKLPSNQERRNKIDLGCGEQKFGEDFFGVDVIETEEADQVQDLDEKDWNLPENSFQKAVARDLYEHLEKPVQFIDNTAEILEDGGTLFIRSPHLCSRNWTDPTHKRLVGIETFDKFFTEKGASNYYIQSNWKVLERRITFRKRKYLPWNYILEPVVNFNDFTQICYERSFLGSIFPSLDVEVVMEVKGR